MQALKLNLHNTRSPIRRPTPGERPLVLLILGLSFLLAACRPEVRSNFGVQNWEGLPLAGELAQAGGMVRLADLKSPGLVLNVYSPTCGPCIEELPALNLLYRRAREFGVAMYIVATANPADHGLELSPDAPRAERVQAIAERLRADVQRYGIQAPMMVMGDEFRVSARDGLITGTPETMFFRPGPLVLEYNFLGPISAAETPESIESETRFKFALRILSRVRSQASGEYDRGPEGASSYEDANRPRL
ncbi:MAG: TlpA family protein disulfide reductase [bacterium]|nr:TlpA family protein disulfide reductase [bacterium]